MKPQPVEESGILAQTAHGGRAKAGCPFCASKEAHQIRVDEAGHHWVQCVNCGAMGPWKMSRTQAVHAWFKRLWPGNAL